MTIPNILTLVRIALVPVFAILFCIPTEWSGFAAGTVFAIACITDWFDGYLARKLNQFSDFGAFLDPVADKLAVSVALILLAYHHESIVILASAVIIISREILVSALREWMAIKGISEVVKVSFTGKLKTAFQMSAIFILFMSDFAPWVFNAGLVLMCVATALSVKSMMEYFLQAATKIDLEAALNGHTEAMSEAEVEITKESDSKIFKDATDGNLHLALASLLYHVITAGHESSERERKEFNQLLRDEFELNQEEVKALYEKVKTLNWSINNDLDTIKEHIKGNPSARFIFMNKLNHLIDVNGVENEELEIFFAAQESLFPDTVDGER